MAESEDVKGKRELFLAKLKEKYPDKEYEDEEQLFGQIYDDYDEYAEASGISGSTSNTSRRDEDEDTYIDTDDIADLPYNSEDVEMEE